MKLNERSLAQFSISSAPVDKEGYLNKKGELNRGYQRRWFVLKGNLFYYFEREGDKEAIGVVILENCHVELAESEDQPYAFQISYGGAGARTYVLGANSAKEMESWMKAITNASYACLKMMVEDLERRLEELTTTQNEMVSDSVTYSQQFMGRSNTTTAEIKTTKHQASNNTSRRIMSFPSGITTSQITTDAFGKFEPSVGTLIDIDSSESVENELFPIPKSPDDLLPLNFNEFKHLEALHSRDLDSYKSKGSQDDSSLLSQRLTASVGKVPRSKSEKRRNNFSEAGQFQAFTKSFVDEACELPVDQMSVFRRLHDMYGASIWVKVKECGKKDLL